MNKINIEEIKQLIPDYITGHLNDLEKKSVDEALAVSGELRSFYNEMKDVLDTASSFQFKEPSSQYYANLLPRIHQRIEEQKEKKEARNPLSIWWKILVPAAAIILIAIIYQFVINNYEQQMTDKDKEQKIEKKDTKDNIEQKKEDVKKIEDKTNEVVKESKDVNKPDNIVPKRYRSNDIKEENFSNVPKKDDELKKEDNKIDAEELASNDIAEPLLIGASEPGVFDEETMEELETLNENDQDILLNRLSESNL